jgi:spermidine synthase
VALKWETLDRVDTPEGPLELRRRGVDQFLITIDGRVLMTSEAHRSEEALAKEALEPLPRGGALRVLVGGLGMGYTLRAALEALPAGARVEVAEREARVVAWCEGPLAPLTNAAVRDRRVALVVDDVARVIGRAGAGRYDVILLDLHEGPHAATQRRDDPFYGPRAIAEQRRALKAGGVLAVWSEEPDRAYERRLLEAGLRVERRRRGRGGRAHTIYLGYT